MTFNKYYEDHDDTEMHQVTDMTGLGEYFKQPCGFRNRFLLFGLSILTVFQPSSAGISGHHDNDLILISNCSAVPQTYCPTAKELIAFREQCINSFERDICPDGTTYLCGVVSGYFIETCAADKECWPGTFFDFIIRNGTATVDCLRCPDGTFETEHTKTSHSSHIVGCPYRHIPQDDISSNLVLYENGTHASPSVYHCKTEEGFYDEHGNKFCDDIPTHSCKCIFKYCQSGYRLHPLGYCVRCKKPLRPEKDWRCEDYISGQTTKSAKNLYVNSTKYLNATATNFGSSGSALNSSSKGITDGKIKDHDIPMVKLPPSDTRPRPTDDVHTSSDGLHTVIGIAGGIVVLILAVVTVPLILIYKGRSNAGRHFHDNSISTTHNYNVSKCTNVQVGKDNEMIIMESPPDVNSHFPEENYNGKSESLPDYLKLDKLESTPFLQDRDQIEKIGRAHV